MADRPNDSGESEGPGLATPDGDGAPSRGFRLPAATRLGPVRLQVANLDRSLALYEQLLGFRVTAREPGRLSLSPRGDDRVLIELEELPGAHPANDGGRLGLYHFAILLPDRASLGALLRRLRQDHVRIGAADHAVSEALYLQDPDGLGIEIYADRPRSSWRRVGDELVMTTDALDVQDLLRAAGDLAWDGMPPGTSIGHVHLHVGNLAAASAYFSEALGFDPTVTNYPGALFLSAGGYHHHLGTNTWAGAAATPPRAEEPRLLEWTIELPDAQSLASVSDSLVARGYEANPIGENGETGLITQDPWGTRIRLRVDSDHR